AVPVPNRRLPAFVTVPPVTAMSEYEFRMPTSMLLAVTLPPVIYKPRVVDGLWRPTVTLPRLAIPPEVIFNWVEPSLLPLLATCVVLLVMMPPLLTTTLHARLFMASVLLVITPPLLMLMVSTELSTSVEVPATL